MVLAEHLQALLEPVVNALGYELVLLEFSPHKGSAGLRLYIDAAAGIRLEDCERVSREVAAALDVADPIRQSYRLEVSSPGLDRPLVKPEHFLRFRGARAKVQTLVPIGGRRRFQGVLTGAEADNVTLATDDGEVRLALADIERARLVPSYDQPGSGRRGHHKTGHEVGTDQ